MESKLSEIQKRVLLVDDDIPTLHFLKGMLESLYYTVETASDVETAVNQLKNQYFPFVISDIHMGQPSGLELLKHIHYHKEPSLLIFITGHASIQTAVSALHEGAFDYICKPMDLHEIHKDLKRTLERAEQHLESLAQEPLPTGTPNLTVETESFVGKSPKMTRLYREIAKASLSDGNVLITGESGTGKELIARSIHENSKRKEQPFVSVNCSALTETLLESELFGHVRGSFTGAVTNKKGLFEQADGGTLFLDEIGDMSQNLQVKLLRAIQYGEIRNVGAHNTKNVNVRVVAATNRNLSEMVNQKTFRDDLYYRLKVFFFELPPLRERKEDLPDLIAYFISRASRLANKSIKGLSPEAREQLLNHHWPGNIRELENAISRAVAISNTNILHTEDFNFEIESQDSSSHSSAAPEFSSPFEKEENCTLEAMERKHIMSVLQKVGFNKSLAAKLLGIDRVTLYRKAMKYGITMAPLNRVRASVATGSDEKLRS